MHAAYRQVLDGFLTAEALAPFHAPFRKVAADLVATLPRGVAVDAVAQTALGTSRVDNAIWVLFVGALTAMIAFGRTLGPARDDDTDTDPAEAAER